MEVKYELLVIGAGPAGITAALYAKRAGLNVAFMDGGVPGGKLVNTYEIENYPGVGLMNGADLASKMFMQVMDAGVPFEYGNVVDIIDHKEYKEVVLESGESMFVKVVLIATGTKERLLNIEGEAKYAGHGVSYCAVCDGAFFKDRQVTVIGGGNSALEEAMYLTQHAKNVRIVIRRDVFRADELVQKALSENEKISVVKKHVPVEIKGTDGKVSSIVLKHVETGELEELPTDAVFPYIGADASTSMCKHLDILDERGYILVNEKMETSIPGVYAAGDVCAKQLRQVVTAVSDGAIAAQNIFHYLKG